MASEILLPLVALACWSLVMWAWMYVSRIPAMIKAGIKLDPTVPPAELTASLPARVRWKADNYNHLMEQPTLFYALTLALAVVGAGDGLNAWIAWAYVIIRIAHSGVQALFNNITVRFTLFVLGTVCLIVLAVQAVRAVMA
jgi:hypothetical protein